MRVPRRRPALARMNPPSTVICAPIASLSLSETGYQRAKNQDRRTHGLDQFIRGDEAIHGARIDIHTHLITHRDLRTHLPEQLERGRHVLKVRHVADIHLTI